MKLHLGCWHRIFPGFINIDLCDLPHINYKSNIDKLPFINSESVDYIYCSHAFEYFDLVKAIEVLKEWNRVLKPGGVLRIAVPDFDKLIEVYNISGDLNRIIGPLYGKMSIKDENGTEIQLFHKIVYNFPLLEKLLINSGYHNVRKYDWRETEHSMYDDHSQAYFPHMDKENGILISLNIEAIKK